jgi:hypothetical protein
MLLEGASVNPATTVPQETMGETMRTDIIHIAAEDIELVLPRQNWSGLDGLDTTRTMTATETQETERSAVVLATDIPRPGMIDEKGKKAGAGAVSVHTSDLAVVPQDEIGARLAIAAADMTDRNLLRTPILMPTNHAGVGDQSTTKTLHLINLARLVPKPLHTMRTPRLP